MSEQFFMGDCDSDGHSPSVERAHALLDECLSLLSALQQPSHSESLEEAKQDRKDRIKMHSKLVKMSRELCRGLIGDKLE